MKYISTRGTGKEYTFQHVLLAGLAEDGGLFVPKTTPRFTRQEISSFKTIPYNELAYCIIRPFTGEDVPDEILKKLIDDSYRDFSHQAVAPLQQLGHNQWVMELFHGPTLAFKDFALQLLGRLLDYVLSERGEHAVVLGATSGDTGSAAIEGCRTSKALKTVILHPHQKVSDVQRRQMTTVLSDAVHNVAIKGDFDDCQNMVKCCFSDQSFLPDNTRLVAVNSINWARIMAQIVYYFYAAVRLGAPDQSVTFSVPTGNFGDIFAGYIARKMGLPIDQLIVATNSNDVLHRFFQNNDYRKISLMQTLSPSMDIMVSSNFERLLFDLHRRDGHAIQTLMAELNTSGCLSIGNSVWQSAKAGFDSYCANDAAILSTIQSVYRKTGYLADPHTATGIHAIQSLARDNSTPCIVLATAHPVKFPEAIQAAGLSVPKLPETLSDLYQREERYTVLPNRLPELHALVQEVIS